MKRHKNLESFVLALLLEVGLEQPLITTQVLEGDVLMVHESQVPYVGKAVASMAIVAITAPEHGGEVLHEMVMN